MSDKQSRKKPSKVKKKQWRSPKLEELGNLSMIINAGGGGKSVFALDGQSAESMVQMA